jgi:hypothetical protein
MSDPAISFTLTNDLIHVHLHEADALNYSPRSVMCVYPGCDCQECEVVRKAVKPKVNP